MTHWIIAITALQCRYLAYIFDECEPGSDPDGGLTNCECHLIDTRVKDSIEMVGRLAAQDQVFAIDISRERQ